jgi:phototropin
MVSVKKADMVESPRSPGEDWEKRCSIQSNPVLYLPKTFGSIMDESDLPGSDGHTTILSPPPTPKSLRPRPAMLSIRLRSNSGLNMHTNQSALRQYTDYNSDGSIRSPAFSPKMLSPTGMGHIDSVSVGKTPIAEFFSEISRPDGSPIANFFHPEVIQMALHNATTAQRLCRFAQTRNSGANMEFLLKVRIQNHIRFPCFCFSCSQC